eukprot:2070231-Rhodomonas_salina.2
MGASLLTVSRWGGFASRSAACAHVPLSVFVPACCSRIGPLLFGTAWCSSLTLHPFAVPVGGGPGCDRHDCGGGVFTGRGEDNPFPDGRCRAARRRTV